VEFDRIRALIRGLAGISLNDAKRHMVCSRVMRLVRQHDVADLRVFLDRVESGGVERTAFINALTTNLTSFFREAYHFPILASYLKTRVDPITIWCAAASTGEEPLSIAITACEALGAGARRVQIVATDIDTDVLARAKEGVYAADRVSQLDHDVLQRYFLRGTGANAGVVRVAPEVQEMVTYFPLNLLGNEWPLPSPFDVIFCRNVMIYFDRPTQAEVLKRMVPWLKPDGLFFAGHSENLQYVSDALTSRGKTVYAMASAGGRVADSGRRRGGAR
jgi:chemotaxis protein methyltransferase CheR